VEEEVKTAPITYDKIAKKMLALNQEHQAQMAAVDKGIPGDFLKRQVKRSGHLKPLLETIYPGGKPTLRFVTDGLAGEGVQAMLKHLADLPSHGFKTTYFPIEKTQEVVSQIEVLESQMLALDGNTEDPALPKLRGVQRDLTPESDTDAVIALLKKGKLHDAHLPSALTFEKELGEKRALFEKRAHQLNELELLLMESLLETASEFKHSKVAHPFRAMKNRRSAFKAFRTRLLEDISTADFSAVGKLLESWIPQSPIYGHIKKGLATYEALAEKGVQTRVSDVVLKPGDQNEHVTTLQQRLTEEGYYDGEHTGAMDEGTLAAIKTYQKTHQLDEDGVVGGGTIRSLNVSFKRRVSQLKLGLMRWRESDSRYQDGFFVRVNLPKFEAQFWQDTTLERTHRVVIGSNAHEVDEDRGIQGKLNRTKIFSDEMERLVINPLWHVPPRIKETELDLELLDEPDFYEKNNYTVRVLEDGTEVVYQNAGPGNALGRVKFLFPNDHSIYMHDTPRKKLFMNRIRAYSHGCMRVHNALDLAEYILERQGLMTGKEFKAVLESKKERGVNLKEHIPVHIDYNTISATADGEIMFLLDIYEYDKAFYDGEVPLPIEPEKIGG